MKQPKMPKLLSEFKQFITRGNVMGLAVGMIIGAAFTAIVNAVVNSILKPLINAVPIGEGVSGLITMLVPRTTDGVELSLAAYNADPALADLAKSVYIDWGAFIMAVITFLLTALVLFFILKALTSVKKGFGTLKSEAEMLYSADYEALKKEGKSKKEIKAILAKERRKRRRRRKPKPPQTLPKRRRTCCVRYATFSAPDRPRKQRRTKKKPTDGVVAHRGHILYAHGRQFFSPTKSLTRNSRGDQTRS